jgi:hypothetical protein
MCHHTQLAGILFKVKKKNTVRSDPCELNRENNGPSGKELAWTRQEYRGVGKSLYILAYTDQQLPIAFTTHHAFNKGPNPPLVCLHSLFG